MGIDFTDKLYYSAQVLDWSLHQFRWVVIKLMLVKGSKCDLFTKFVKQLVESVNKVLGVVAFLNHNGQSGST